MFDDPDGGRSYLKVPGGHADGSRGDLADCWAVVSRDAKGDDEVVAYVDTEGLADALLFWLTGHDRPFNFVPNEEYS